MAAEDGFVALGAGGDHVDRDLTDLLDTVQVGARFLRQGVPALRAEGGAQAAAILATGEAEAEAMNKRADAYARYNEAAVLQMLVEVLPKVARELASPMAAIDQLTVISTGSNAPMARKWHWKLAGRGSRLSAMALRSAIAAR